MKLKYWKKSEASAYLSLNDEIWGVLSNRTLRRLYPLASELEVSETEAQELISRLEKKAWAQITEYLAKAEHSEHQCRQYLGRKNYHNSIIDKCIELCKTKGYLDDARFSEILIRSLLERGKSTRAISEKLYEQRIPASLYEPILQELQDPEQSLELLKQQIQKLLFRHREQEPWKAKEKVFASLFRKGFPLDDITRAWDDLAL
ncbi:MAG: RecX family transcriptional regulator [Candidatus Cloacimonadaceae bacterium]|jgi:regulatory protein|nr:RecX family transcriptional regulator [Candidatus Cloacimonadota bacterium]MDY0127519.1 RecX family transcriptional regulator [Candidatus Cloacimonadaceae bacterium]MCB5254720.1 RecX family transcriptional regulator [Candidatus Cloacimonadota bacterium]MCK9177975.1 RecX family transcriptional regulator [Candidatus Cloacimonadota bacterium]MCK9242377.1 RecX family transcriptional regulator [Candidatus Cloacimonadota bacterium]